MVKCGVFFAVRTVFLNIIYTSFGFKGLAMLLGTLMWRVVLVVLEQGFPTFLNGETLDKTSAILWHPTYGETHTLTFHSIRNENT
jgi:hypothetical protein